MYFGGGYTLSLETISVYQNTWENTAYIAQAMSLNTIKVQVFPRFMMF